MYPIRKIRSDYQAINEWLFRLFGDKIIMGTYSEVPFFVAIPWILRIPKFIESWRNIRGNGHFNKGIKTQSTTPLDLPKKRNWKIFIFKKVIKVPPPQKDESSFCGPKMG